MFFADPQTLMKTGALAVFYSKNGKRAIKPL